MNFDHNNIKSDSNILFAAELCQIAYFDEETIITKLNELCEKYTRTHFFYGKNIFGFVAEFNNAVFVVFKGSQTRGDWLNNFDIRVLPTFCGHIHYGFAKTLDSIPIQAIHLIAQTIQEPKPLFLAGHSRGGALAVLGSALLKVNGYSPKAVYTFGQPKVGGATFVSWWQKNMECEHIRVVTQNDIVPLLPPSNWNDIVKLLRFGCILFLYKINWPYSFPFGKIKLKNHKD